MNDNRSFAELMFAGWEKQIQGPRGAIKPWAAELAEQEMLAARLVLDLPTTDARYADAPFVAIEAIARAAMLFGVVAGDKLSEKDRFALMNKARAGAAAKLKNDPKQRAKAAALRLWQERHAGKHPHLRTNEQFAMEVLRRYPVLTSSSVICGWCAMWTREAKSQLAG